MTVEIESLFKTESGKLFIGANSQSFNKEYEYYLKVPKEEGCAILFRNIEKREDEYYTEIRQEMLLFEKTKLEEVSDSLLRGEEVKFPGIWVFDDYEWDDSIPGGLTGDGKWVCPAEITLTPGIPGEPPKVSFVLKDEGPFVGKIVDRFTKFRRGLPSLLYFDCIDEVTYKMGTDQIDESGGGSYHDIDDIVFDKSDLAKLVLTAAVSPDRSAKIIVDAKETADIEYWPYGAEDGRSFHCQDKPIKIELSLKIDVGYQTKFTLREIPPIASTASLN
jgi:hypothetical protein